MTLPAPGALLLPQGSTSAGGAVSGLAAAPFATASRIHLQQEP